MALDDGQPVNMDLEDMEAVRKALLDHALEELGERPTIDEVRLAIENRAAFLTAAIKAEIAADRARGLLVVVRSVGDRHGPSRSSLSGRSIRSPSRSAPAYLARYRAENATLGAPRPGEQRVVFMGNSITEAWAKSFDTMFPGKPYVGRGISGQTTPQMLVRFRQDVIALQPAVVVILAGTNDIAGNTGPSTIEMIEANLASMAELAQSMAELAHSNGIRVVLSSVLPVYDYPWRPGLEPAPKIIALNAWMKDYAATHGMVYLDYHTAMADARGGLRREFGDDGVHPNEAGYRVMAPLVEMAIAEALRRR